MMNISRKQFITGTAACAVANWFDLIAGPVGIQRGFWDMTWWDPYVANIMDADTYLRRKFRQDVTDKTTGVGVAALKKILAEVVASGKGFESPYPAPFSPIRGIDVKVEIECVAVCL